MRPLCAAVLWITLIVGVARAVDLSGPWRLEFQRDSSSTVYQADCVWEQEGSRVSGGCTSGFESIVSIRGSIDDSRVTFRFTTAAEAGTTMTFSGQLNDKETAIDGTWRSVDAQGATSGGTFTATKR